MASKEKLYERRLRRRLDDQLKSDIKTLFESRRSEIPIEVEIDWHPREPILSLRGPMGVTIYAHFLEPVEKLEVFAEYGFAARMFVTDRHRAKARDVIHEIAEDLEL
ncbi:hypothetical protein GC170_07045 [bacterium]|nr:hypothetical protein [bacterium]